MAKKKYTPEATVDLLYNQLMSDYKGDAQVEAERQRQKSAERKASGNSTNSSTSAQNTLQSSSAVSRGASAVGNIYKAPKRKYTTGKTTHGYTTARSFAKDQTTKPKTSGTRGIGSATQEAFERGLSSRSLKENVGQRSSLSNKKSYTKESDLNDFSRNRSHNQAKILDKKQAYVQAQRYENDLKKQRAEYDRLREEHPTSEWLKEEGWGALTGFNSTLASTADWLLPDVITPKPVQNALDYYKREDEKQQKKVEEVRGGDPLRTIGGNLGVNIIQNIPAMLLAPLTAEGTIATTAGTLLNPETLSQTGNAITRALYSVARETGNNPMFWETFLRTAGPTYDKEIESGADPVRATLSALTNGLLNAQIEVGGGIEKFDPTETFWKALRRSGEEEGLEEVQQYAVEGLTNKALGSNTAKWFSTKRGEDAVINPIDMAEQGAYGALAGGLMGGGRAGVATLSRSLADAEYNRAFPDSKAHTQDLVEQALMQAREGQKSSEAEILATNIQNMMEQGEEVPTVLVRQLHNEVLRAQAENERDFSERKNEGYQQAVSEGRANTVETQDTEEESRVFRSVADEKAQTYYDTAMDKMGENASEKSARAISKLMVGVHTNQDIDTILIDKNARNAVEEMTGIDLPIKNTDAREILETRGLANMVANRDNMLQETHNVIRSNMRGREGAVFEKNYDNAVKTIGVANAPEIYESVFSRFKNAGMVRGSDFDSAYDRIVSPLTKDFGEELGGRISLVFNRDFAHQAFDAGRQAYIADEAKTSAREKAVSAERAGTVTYKHDTESRLSTRQKKFMTEFAKRAKLGIEFYDGTQEGEDDSANGYYENGVIHININSTNKLITVAKHELTHHIKVTAPEMYRKLEDFVIKKWYNNDPDAFDERILEYQRKWNCSVEVAYEEIIANASEAFFTDRGTIDDAIKFSKKLGHTIHDGIRTLLDTFLDIQDTDRLGDRGYGEFLKDLKILKDAQRMWLEALDQSVNRSRGRNASEVTEADTEVRRSLKDIGMTLKDGNARWTDERIDNLIDEYGASNPDYSQAYAVLMSPRDFLKLTLADEKLDEWNEASSSDNPAYSNYFRKLNTEDLKNEKQTPFLTIYSNDGFEVQGHEGRHRMRALLEAGVKSVPVVIRDTDTKYTKKPLESMTLSSQDFGYDPVNNGAEITIKDLVPIKESNRDELIEKFGGEAEVRFSKKDDQDYLDAVNRGDMETAQRMVDEYAKKAGYDVKAYHGTSNFGFTKFSTRDNNGNRIETENGRVFGDGFYFTDNKDVAEKRYANVLSRSRLVDGEWVTEKTNRGVYNVYLNLGNNYVLDWNDTKGMSQRDFDRLIRDIWKDHNSLTIKNIRDGIDITSTVYVVEMTPENAEQYWDTAWSSSRIKSADPVTYDDNGNVIPLSERFNEKNEDIRWSHKTEHEALPKARTIPKKIKDRLIALGADKLGKGGLKAPIQISVRDLRTLWYNLKGSEEGERLNTVLEVIGDELQELAGKYRYVSLADALEGTIHYRVDENGKPTSIVLSCKVKNAEYDINFDFTTICAKRAPLQKVLERFIKTEGKNKGETLYDELKLDEEGLYTLRSIMEQEGFDVSCIGCFVEQNRYAQQTQSKTVADDWNKALDEWAKEHGVEITEGFDFQNLDIDQLPYSEIQKGFRQYSALMKGKPTTVENKNKALIEAIPYLRKRLGNSDYASIAGQRAMMAMGNGKTNLYNLLKRGQGDSKQSTPFVPYNGEVALLPETKKGKKIFDYLFGIGGARAQSASDFQIEYVFDYMQLVGDLSARGLPMHMYTKVIECAELLGMCGIKINLSAMCDVDSSVDGEHAGLKKVNDEWVYNISKQSIDYERAVKLQRKKGYRKNIGIIMVVLSKQHMLKALSDADVRYIIGYHSSKMPPIVARASKMEGATDYTKLNKTNRLNDKGRALFAEAMSQAKGKTELEKYKDALRIFDDLIQTDKLKTRGEVPRRGNEYTRYMSSFKANTADFDVYDDIKKTNDPRTTADNYIRYCMENDLVPMYFPFAFHENYYKCEVYDYNVYDNETGEYAPMEAVQNIYPELNIANGETDTKRFMAKVRKMVKRQNKKNAKVEPKYEAVERRAIAELSITGNDYMDMDASGIDHAELEHRVDMTEEAVEERRRSIKEKELNAKTIEYQSTIRKLEKNVEGLKAQFKRTNKKPNPVEARRQAGRLIQRHASNMRIHEDVANTLTEIYEMYAKRGAKAFDDIYAIAERTAVEIVNNISEVHFEGQEEYNQIKDYLRDTNIVVSEEMKRNITDFNDFRKSHFGKLKLVNGERSNIDSVYAELSEMFPSQFTDEYVNPADQLNHIADVLDSYAPFYETLDGTSEEMQDYVVAIASDLMETAYNLQNKKTFADKKYDEKVKAVKKAREKALANKKEALSKLRDKYNRRMAEAVRMAETETRAETEFNIYEKAEKKRRIAQIAKIHKRLTEKLLTPSDTKHLPDGYNKIVAEVLGMFDFTTRGMVRWVGRYAVPSERMTAMLNLRRALQEYTTNEEESEIEIDKDMVDVVDILEGAFGEDIKVSDLNLETLENVVVMLRGFEHQINSYNRAFDENNKQRISDLADKVVDEASKVKHGKWRAGIMGRVFTSNLNPWDFFQMIGGEVGDLYKATRKGFDKYENNLRVAKKFMADLIGSKQYDKWANHTKTYKTTSGEEITLTDTQLMSLYCLSKREQAQGHIYGQGVVSAPVKVKRNMIAKQLDKKRVIPTFDDVVDWTKNLSKEQIEVADKIQNFLSNEVAEWGNETSLKLYGYKKFTEKDYFPIQSSDDYLNSNFDAKGSDPTLKNISPTKAVVKGANNPLMLDDIFSIFSKHVAQMASYNGFVPAITDFQRVWNHKMVSADGRKTTVKETFGEAYGDRIAKYVEQFYADLNGVYKKNLDVTTPEKLFGTFKKSAVGGNLRVLAQQPMAIARAMLLVDPTLLTVAVPKTALQAKRTYQEMLEHCPIAEWKVWGFYSPDVMGASRDLKNVMLGKDSISDKVFMNMYGVADNITWTVIFNACKMQVERQNKGIAKGSQEYWDKVNDLASDVYDATQVVDSPFHRSELMKSQDGIHKMATAFMAEPTKTVNMLNTQLTLCAREISEGKVGKATLRFTRLTGTVLANAMLLAVGQSLIDAMRSAGGGDDDDDKGDFEERFKKHWVTNTKDNLNLLKMLPYVKDAVSIYEGFGVTRMDMNGVEKAVKATQNLKKYYDDPGSAKYTELELWNNTAMAFAYTLGVPISNAKRDLDALALTVAESVKDPKVMLWYMKNKYQVNSKTKSIWADAYYDALDKGNKTLANNIYAYMKKSGVDDKYIQNREKTWEKHRYGEEEEE